MTTQNACFVTTSIYEEFKAVFASTESFRQESDVVNLKPDHVSVDDFFAAFMDDAEFQSEVALATQEIGEKFYPGELSLRAIRMQAGLTQAQLALKAGTTQAQIARIENGACDCKTSTVVKLANALNYDSGELFKAIASTEENIA